MLNLNPTHVTEWIDELSCMSRGKFRPPQFLQPFHFVTLALRIKQRGWDNLELPDELKGYALRMNLWEAAGLEAPAKVPRSLPKGLFLPVQRLAFNDDRDDIISKSNELIDTQFQTTKNARDSLSACLQEIFSNFYDHSEIEVDLPGLACAQSWPNGNRVQIAIADKGVGIRDSLSQNSELNKELKKTNSCELASRYGITSKPGQQHSGYGLTLAKDLMRLHAGSYLLLSGREIYYCNKQTSGSCKLDTAWDGTLLIIEWPINQRLDSSAVYKSWPQVAGFESDDFDL